MDKPIAIDLFCGAGGFSEGILQSGFHIIFSSDINEMVEKTYKNRHEELGYVHGANTYYYRNDIRNLSSDMIFKSIGELKSDFNSTKEIDAIFGGPPCQGFSRAGKRNSDDPRNMLFKEYIRVVKEVQPKYVVMENVEGFMDSVLEDFIGVTDKKYFGKHKLPDILLSEFTEINYLTLEPKILNSSDYGVPQNRKRAIFIAYRNDQEIPKYPSTGYSPKTTVKDALNDLYDKPMSSYAKSLSEGNTKSILNKRIKKRGVLNFSHLNHSQIVLDRFSLFQEGESVRALKKRIISKGILIDKKIALLKYLQINSNFSISELITKFKKGDVDKELLQMLLTKKANRIKLSRETQSNTILTLPDDYISPYSNKALTVREMARIQSFDDSFEFLGKKTTGGKKRRTDVPQYTQVGNAVPPLLARSIATEIKKVLN